MDQLSNLRLAKTGQRNAPSNDWNLDLDSAPLRSFTSRRFEPGGASLV